MYSLAQMHARAASATRRRSVDTVFACIPAIPDYVVAPALRNFIHVQDVADLVARLANEYEQAKAELAAKTALTSGHHLAFAAE